MLYTLVIWGGLWTYLRSRCHTSCGIPDLGRRVLVLWLGFLPPGLETLLPGLFVLGTSSSYWDWIVLLDLCLNQQKGFCLQSIAPCLLSARHIFVNFSYFFPKLVFVFKLLYYLHILMFKCYSTILYFVVQFNFIYFFTY